MATVFLSRDLRSAGLFASIMQQAGWPLQAVSLLVFRAEDYLLPEPAPEWLFFYSRKGVRFFRREKALLAACKLAALGPGTAEELEKLGWTPDFVGSGNPQEVADAFAPLAKGQRVAFVQARQSRQSVEKSLGVTVTAIPLAVYDNVPKQEIDVKPSDYLVFTSSLNFFTYLMHYPVSPTSRYVAIGRSTAEAFIEAGVTNYRIANKPSEQSLAACVLRWEEEEPRLA